MIINLNESRGIRYNLLKTPTVAKINKILAEYDFGTVEYAEYTDRFNDIPMVYMDLKAFSIFDIYFIDYGIDLFRIKSYGTHERIFTTEEILALSRDLYKMSKCVDELNKLDLSNIVKEARDL